jgi:hypothetical protein
MHDLLNNNNNNENWKKVSLWADFLIKYKYPTVWLDGAIQLAHVSHLFTEKLTVQPRGMPILWVAVQ